MNPSDFLEEDEAKPPKIKRDGVEFARSLERLRLGFVSKNTYIDKYNLQAMAEDTLVKKEFNDMACELPGLPRSTFLMVFSPDGTIAASTHGNHNIYITDIKTGRNIKVLVGHPRTPWCIAFHPTSNQIVASGCLGGQVRIWDLSGGSEMWTADSQTVIASIAFHPDDRVLVIATYNQLYFWDWSKPEPFMHISTASIKEKVRYVAFDKLGHKLITGIANDNMQSRWVRPSVSTPRRNERSMQHSSRLNPASYTNRDPPAASSNVPDRERRITACYRNLVYEYEHLVRRYLQIYRPPTMVDQGTDPMEMEETNSSNSNSNPRSSGMAFMPSTSRASPPDFLRQQAAQVNRQIIENLIRTTGQSSLAPRFRIARNPIRGINIENSDGSIASDPIATGPTYRVVASLTLSRHYRNHAFSLLERIDIDSSTPATEEELQVIRIAMESGMALPAHIPRPPEVQNSPGNENGQCINFRERLLDDNVRSTSSRENGPSPTTSSSGETRPQRNTSWFDFVRISPSRDSAQISSHSSARIAETEQRLQEIMDNNSHPYYCPPMERYSPPPRSTRRVIIEDDDDTDEETPTPLNINSSDPLLSSVMSDSNDAGEGTSSGIRSRGEKRHLARSNSDEASGSGVIPSKRVNNIDLSNRNDNQSVEEQQNQNNEGMSRIRIRRNESSSSTARMNVELLAMLSHPIERQHLLGQIRSDEETPPRQHFNLEQNHRPTPTYGSPRFDLRGSSSSGNLTNMTLSNLLNVTPRRNSRGNDSSTASQTVNNSSGGEDTSRRSVDGSCARTNLPCSSSRIGLRSSPNSANRRRFFSHVSAFCPPRVFSPIRTNRNRRPNPSSVHGRMPNMSLSSMFFGMDEVVNYSEMSNAEGENNSSESQQNTNNFSNFEPSPIPTPAVESTNTADLYTSLVEQVHLLREVHNIPTTGRPDEASYSLNNFSERLEQILEQSQTILGTLGSSIDQISSSEPSTSRSPVSLPTELDSRAPQVSFNNSEFYVRDRTDLEPRTEASDPVSTDHSYPMRNYQNRSSNLASASLYCNVSQIQSQTRFLRQQVESIERIISAMIEVTQLQTIRQILTDLQQYYQLPSSEPTFRNPDGDAPDPSEPSTSSTYQSNETTETSEPFRPPSRAEQRPEEEPDYMQPGAPRGPPESGTNRPYARCIFLMRARRTSCLRRIPSRERLTRRYLFRRHCPTILRPTRNTPERQENQEEDPLLNASFTTANMPSLLRRLEHYLLEHARLMGQSISPTSNAFSSSSSSSATDVGENLLTLHLNNCRIRANNVFGSELQNDSGTVSRDGRGRYAARQTLVFVIDMLLRFAETHRQDPVGTVQTSHLLEYIELSLLLSEVLLLQIVDSIPPPPNNPSQNRQPNNSEPRGRRKLCSIRMDLNDASEALNLTYTARRNELLPAGGDRTRRMQLIREIHDCLRNIRRRGGLVTAISLNRITLPIRERLRTSNLDPLSSRGSSGSSSNSNASGSRNTNPSSDDSSTSSEQPTSRLYRTNNVNLLGSDPAEDSVSRSRPWDVPLVQVNDMPVDNSYVHSWQRSHNRLSRDIRMTERLNDWRIGHGLFRPRFLHPLYNTVVNNNPFDSDVEDQPRDQIFEGDFITTVTHNHRIQMWRFSSSHIPNISNPMKNIVVNECKIHNDASVDIATDGSMLVTLLPSSGYLNITNRLGVYSLNWETLGQCLYITSLEHNAVSVSLSPLSRHLVVGLATRRISIISNDKWTMARIFTLDSRPEVSNGRLSAIRQLEQNRDTTTMSVNCIRWLPISGHGLVYGTNTGQLRVLS